MKTMKATKKLTPLPKLLKKTQDVFNKFIRSRDVDRGCISCNGPVAHAGHYLSQGAHSALRFHEVNVNGQCVSCNLFKSGNLIKYRQGLVKKYGENEVKELENLADLHKKWKWSRIELEQIIEKYKTK